MSKKIVIKRPTPLHQFTFCSNLSTEKSTNKRNNLIHSTNLKTTSRITTPTKFFIKRTQSILKRNQTLAIMNSTKRLNSVIVSHKDKLDAFNTIVDDIYQPQPNNISDNDHDNGNSNHIRQCILNQFQYEQPHRKLNRLSISVPKLKAPSLVIPIKNQTKTTKELLIFFKKKNKEIIKHHQQASELKKKRLLRANVGHVNIDETKQLPLSPDMFIKKNRFIMNRFILKVLDPEACLDDYTPEKGTQNQYFNKFKIKLNKESKRITDLLDNIKKAEAMNETWLKFYCVKLRNAQSKYYHMPQVNKD